MGMHETANIHLRLLGGRLVQMFGSMICIDGEREKKEVERRKQK